MGFVDAGIIKNALASRDEVSLAYMISKLIYIKSKYVYIMYIYIIYIYIGLLMVNFLLRVIFIISEGFTSTLATYLEP